MPTILHVAHETEVWAGLVQMHASSLFFVYLLVEIAHGVLMWCTVIVSATANNKDILKPADMVPPTARSRLSNETDTLPQEVKSWQKRSRTLPVGSVTSTRMQLYGDYLWSTSDSLSFVSQIASQSGKASFVRNHKPGAQELLAPHFSLQHFSLPHLMCDMTQTERSNLTHEIAGEIGPDGVLYDPGIGIVSVIPGWMDHDAPDVPREIAQVREILEAVHFVNQTPLELLEHVPFEPVSSDRNGFEPRTRNRDPTRTPYYAVLPFVHLSYTGWFIPYYTAWYASEDMELQYPSLSKQTSFETAVLMFETTVLMVVNALNALNALSSYFGPDLVGRRTSCQDILLLHPFCPIGRDAGETDRNVYFVHLPPCFRCENVMGALLLLLMLCFAGTHSQPVTNCFPNPIGSKAKYSSFRPGSKGSGDGEHHRLYRYTSTYSVSSVNPSRLELLIILTMLMGHT